MIQAKLVSVTISENLATAKVLGDIRGGLIENEKKKEDPNKDQITWRDFPFHKFSETLIFSTKKVSAFEILAIMEELGIKEAFDLKHLLSYDKSVNWEKVSNRFSLKDMLASHIPLRVSNVLCQYFPSSDARNLVKEAFLKMFYLFEAIKACKKSGVIRPELYSFMKTNRDYYKYYFKYTEHNPEWIREFHRGNPERIDRDRFRDGKYKGFFILDSFTWCQTKDGAKWAELYKEERQKYTTRQGYEKG